MAHSCHSDVFSETIAEMTYLDVAAAAERGAVMLWGIGVIEQHGPHLPTGTDVYLPAARLRGVKSELSRRGIEALILPPYYWGVNVVSGAFPASYDVPSDLMRQILTEILCGVAADGFTRVFCFSGHGDALHNQTIFLAVENAIRQSGADISLVLDASLVRRLQLDPASPAITMTTGAPLVLAGDSATQSSSPMASAARPGADQIDVHAGCWETSMLLASRPELVRDDIRRELPSTVFDVGMLESWRRGYADARAIAPDGYVGDPASASRAEGASLLDLAIEEACAAIELRIST